MAFCPEVWDYIYTTFRSSLAHLSFRHFNLYAKHGRVKNTSWSSALQLYHQRCLGKAHGSTRDHSHSARTLFSLLPSAGATGAWLNVLYQQTEGQFLSPGCCSTVNRLWRALSTITLFCLVSTVSCLLLGITWSHRECLISVIHQAATYPPVWCIFHHFTYVNVLLLYKCVHIWA